MTYGTPSLGVGLLMLIQLMLIVSVVTSITIILFCISNQLYLGKNTAIVRHYSLKLRTFGLRGFWKNPSLEQICHYLDDVGDDVRGLRALIAEDTVLQELAQSPLMLHIMTLAYQGVAVEDLPRTEVVEERRRQLFDDYIEKMFHRPNRSKGEQKYLKCQTKYWLIWLAQKMIQKSQTVFFIEGMQPNLFQNKTKIINYLINTINYLFPWLNLLKEEIKPIETLRSPWQALNEIRKKNKKILLEIGLSFLIKNYMNWQLINNVFIDGLRGSDIEMKIIPNQGIKKSALNGILIGLVFGLANGGIGLILGLPGLTIIPFIELSICRSIGLMGFIFGFLVGGGKACIQHLTLRLILYYNGYIPWNYARFLNYATERIFLQKVGGGYIFIHRMLMEHFAQMQPER